MIDKNAVGAVVDLADPAVAAIVDTVAPYLPALKRCGTAAFGAIVDAISSQNWSAVDKLAYAHMTEAERNMLSDKILKDAREVVNRAYEAKRSFKTDLIKIVLGIAAALV